MDKILATLAALGLNFYIMAGIALIGTLIMFLISKAAGNRVMIALMAIFGSIIAYMGGAPILGGLGVHKIITLGFGFLSIIGVIVAMAGKKPGMLAKVLVAISVLGGFVYLWFF